MFGKQFSFYCRPMERILCRPCVYNKTIMGFRQEKRVHHPVINHHTRTQLHNILGSGPIQLNLFTKCYPLSFPSPTTHNNVTKNIYIYFTPTCIVLKQTIHLLYKNCKTNKLHAAFYVLVFGAKVITSTPYWMINNWIMN